MPEFCDSTRILNWFACFHIFHSCTIVMYRSSRPEVSCKGVLRNFKKFTGKHLCQSFFLKKETLAHVFSCEFCELCKEKFFQRAPLVAAFYIVRTFVMKGLMVTYVARKDFHEINLWKSTIMEKKTLIFSLWANGQFLQFKVLVFKSTRESLSFLFLPGNFLT